jgi:hypothetical protein
MVGWDYRGDNAAANRRSRKAISYPSMYSNGIKATFQKIYDMYKRLYNREAHGNITGIIAAIPSITETFRSLIKEIKKNKTTTLIIDLRSNGGGNSLISAILCYFLYGKSKLHLLDESSYSIKRYSELFFKYFENRYLEEINKERPDYELTWEKLVSYQFDPQASLMLALEVAKQ